MGLITWDDSLSVQVTEIDNQHKKLIDIINNLSDAMRERKGNEVMTKILSDLASYTQTHFKWEERHFQKFNYKDTPAHLKEHEKFVDQIKKYKADFESGKLAMSIEVMNFLSDWLRGHIKGTDQKYTSFFHENGIR